MALWGRKKLKLSFAAGAASARPRPGARRARARPVWAITLCIVRARSINRWSRKAMGKACRCRCCASERPLGALGPITEECSKIIPKIRIFVFHTGATSVRDGMGMTAPSSSTCATAGVRKACQHPIACLLLRPNPVSPSSPTVAPYLR